VHVRPSVPTAPAVLRVPKPVGQAFVPVFVTQLLSPPAGLGAQT